MIRRSTTWLSSRQIPASVALSSIALASLSTSGLTVTCLRVTVFGRVYLMLILTARAFCSVSVLCCLAKVSVACLRHAFRFLFDSYMKPARLIALEPCGMAVPSILYSCILILCPLCLACEEALF